MKLPIVSRGSEAFPSASPACNVVCSVSARGQRELTCQGQGQRSHLLILRTLPSLVLYFPPLLLNISKLHECESVCVWVTKCVCVSACACTLSAWHGARRRQISSWRKHYSIAYSIQITQMFIATSTITGGEGWTFGRRAGPALRWAELSDAFWQQVKRNWLECVPLCSHIKKVLSSAKALKVQHTCAVFLSLLKT